MTVDEADFLRRRRQLANVALLETLSRATDQRGEPIFSVKGGVSMEIEFGMDARATSDLDVGFRSTPQELERQLLDALSVGWDGFEFRIAHGLEPIAETGSLRCEVKVTYEGSVLLTVPLEIGFAEGAVGTEIRMLANKAFGPELVGLTEIHAVPAVTAGYSIAQKLHACTDHSNPTRENERSRDMIDIITLWRRIASAEREGLRVVCLDIFDRRGKQAWPPTVTVPSNWGDEYPLTANELNFEPVDVHEAAAEVNAIIALIDGNNHLA